MYYVRILTKYSEHLCFEVIWVGCTQIHLPSIHTRSETIFSLILVALLVAVLFACLVVGHSVITEATYKRCISDANQKFATLTENIYKADNFFGTINNLKCIYVSSWFVLILKVNFVNGFLLTKFFL